MQGCLAEVFTIVICMAANAKFLNFDGEFLGNLIAEKYLLKGKNI